MAKARDIVAEIAATIPPNRHGSRPWYERVAAEHGELLAAIRAGWHDGAFGAQRNPAAKAISAKLKECGIEIGTQGVLHWLRLPRS
jgi:hypothetical protein